MLSSIFTIGLVALTSLVTAQDLPTITGPQCPADDLQFCKNKGAWGCVKLEGPNCVKQTNQCGSECGGSGFAYQKDNSDDTTCICTHEDLSLPVAPPPVLRGGQCGFDGLQRCKFQGAWGCVLLEGPNCVDQTTQCDTPCGGVGFAYKKHESDDDACVCSREDASQSTGGFKRSFKA